MKLNGQNVVVILNKEEIEALMVAVKYWNKSVEDPLSGFYERMQELNWDLEEIYEVLK